MAKLERTEKPINVILNECTAGELRLPEIQRGYVWKRTQVRDLVESLYKEYPCGILLYWKPPEDLLESLKLKSFDLQMDSDKQSRKPFYLVLDGQQRLTSLLAVMSGETPVFFNLLDESFQIYSNKIKGSPEWVSVTRVLQEGAISVWLSVKDHLSGANEKLCLERLSRLERIKEYRLPVEVLHTDDYEEVTEAFIRINSRGTKLREAELALAQLAFHWPGAVTRNFEEALEQYNDAGFDFDVRFLMRCFVSIATNQCRFKFLSKLWSMREQQLADEWRRTRQGLDHTVNFLRQNVGLESSDWIPSLNALVPLVVFFAKARQVSDVQERLLLFWFYSATMWGRYSGSPETKLDQDLSVLEPDGMKGLLTNLQRDVRDLVVDPEELQGSYYASPFLPVLFAIVRRQKAKDWFTGVALSATNVGPEHSLELHHFFPKSVLRKNGFKTKEIDDLANIAFLSKRANRTVLASEPTTYVTKYKIEESRLEAQLIPTNRDLWRLSNYPKFLNERRRLMANAMNEYLRSLGGDEYMKKV